MWIDAELVLSSYKPLKLEKGMLFVRSVDRGVLEMYELDHIVHDDEAYMTINGCPVEAHLFEYTPANPCFNQLATPNEIGWIDEEDSDEMHEITIDDFNVILRNKMRCKIQVAENLYYKGMYVPVFDEEKVIIRLIEEEE